MIALKSYTKNWPTWLEQTSTLISFALLVVHYWNNLMLDLNVLKNMT